MARMEVHRFLLKTPWKSGVGETGKLGSPSGDVRGHLSRCTEAVSPGHSDKSQSGVLPGFTPGLPCLPGLGGWMPAVLLQIPSELPLLADDGQASISFTIHVLKGLLLPPPFPSLYCRGLVL